MNEGKTFNIDKKAMLATGIIVASIFFLRINFFASIIIGTGIVYGIPYGIKTWQQNQKKSSTVATGAGKSKPGPKTTVSKDTSSAPTVNK